MRSEPINLGGLAAGGSQPCSDGRDRSYSESSSIRYCFHSGTCCAAGGAVGAGTRTPFLVRPRSLFRSGGMFLIPGRSILYRGAREEMRSSQNPRRLNAPSERHHVLPVVRMSAGMTKATAPSAVVNGDNRVPYRRRLRTVFCELGGGGTRLDFDGRYVQRTLVSSALWSAALLCIPGARPPTSTPAQWLRRGLSPRSGRTRPSAPWFPQKDHRSWT